MKALFCAALLLAGSAHAGELLPVQGDEAPAVQEAMDEYALSAIQALPDHIKVEAVIESIDVSGKAKRIFLGPFAGGGHIKLRVRIIDSDSVSETLIEDKTGTWKGTVQWGVDGNMLKDVAIKAAEFVTDYSRLINK